ncbi:GATA transcription factor 1 isoform X2 [Humulus lupulus]|uniref:GATA transcription factor 1 isoform X2 n=1 Tax=Humulus lupulus TaxID=3486 RepID=UPI002B4065DE|nr:GATA transcription factor 1 isoform X2 [Humulus lupulus]
MSFRTRSVQDIGKEEEELEWISNKDSFPAVESLADILSDHPGSGVASLKLHSPVSVLEGEGSGSSSSNDSNNTNTSATTLTSCFGGLKPPRRARSKRRCRRRRGSYFDLTGKQQCLSIKHCGDRYIDTVKAEKAKEKAAATKKKTMKSSTMMMMTTAKMMTTTITGRKCQHCGAEKTPQWRAGPYGPKTLCNACGVRYKSGRLVPEYRPASSPSFSSELHSNSHRKIIEMRKVKNMVGMVLNNPAESG